MTKPYREETSVFYSVHKNRSYLLRYLEILKKGATVRLIGRIARDLDATESSDRLRLRVVIEHLEIKGMPRSYSEVA